MWSEAAQAALSSGRAAHTHTHSRTLPRAWISLRLPVAARVTGQRAETLSAAGGAELGAGPDLELLG